MALSRRKLLRNGWKTGGVLLASDAVWTSWELLRPLTSGASGGKLRVGAAGDFVAGTATYIREGRFWLANAGGDLFALSQKCPHLGCRVPFCESSGRFECPCHGSVFDIGGEWIEGPSPRGMDRHPVSLDGETLVVDTGKRLDGPDRGAEKFLTPAKGPACRTEA
jgi:cytochrome b6-f complex iron-sulfur subunit